MPGWVGDTCNRKMEWIHFQSRGSYSIRPQVLMPSQTTHVQLFVLPGQTEAGGIFSAIGNKDAQVI